MKHRCDTCGAARSSRVRLCAACFASLPAQIANAINLAWRRGERKAHRAAVTNARALLAAANRARPSPAEFQDQLARLTGERDAA